MLDHACEGVIDVPPAKAGLAIAACGHDRHQTVRSSASPCACEGARCILLAKAECYRLRAPLRSRNLLDGDLGLEPRTRHQPGKHWKMSKNECESTLVGFLVNQIFRFLSPLFSMECSSSTGTCNDCCASDNAKSPDSMRPWRNRQYSCGSAGPHECWRNHSTFVNKCVEFRFGAGMKSRGS